MFIPDRKNIIAQQTADFRSALKAGGFPPLVPNCFLKTPQDLRNNAGPSYLYKAAKGVKPGAKISPRLKTSPLPSWCETWTKAEDWLPVPKGQEDVLRWGLGPGFRVQYGHPLQVVIDVDEMASSHGAFGSMRMERVNTWLASLESASIPPPDTIEFVNAYGCIDRMFRIPPKAKKEQQQAKRKPATPSPPLPTKYLQQSPKLSPKSQRQSSSEFPIRDRKGKGKVKSLSDEDKEIKELINDTMSQIFGALKFEETSKGLNYVIDRALAGNNWIEKPPTAAKEENWFQGLTAHKPMPSSSQIKDLEPKYFNRDPLHFHEKKKRHCFHGTAAKEDRIAARKVKERGESFLIKIEKYGNVNHSPENPVWKIPGFCYLECINLALERGHFWPANPTVYTFANFGQKYRKPIDFCLVETEPGKHFTIRTFPDGDSILAWKHLEFLAMTKKSFMHVGGDGTDSAIKLLDGTNYKQWAPKMRAWLMSKELCGYVSGTIPCPKVTSIPKPPVPDAAGLITTAMKEAYEDELLTFNTANEKFIKWNVEDDKAIGGMQL